MEPDDAIRPLLARYRTRAERLLNGVRALVLLLLAIAAAVYAPSLPRALSWANVIVLSPTLAWTFAQWVLFSGDEVLPGWLSTVNPLVDITAVTVIMGSYGVTQSAALALRSPIFLAYFAILASRPITSSTRKAALAAALVVLEYAALLAFFVLTGRLHAVASPLVASMGAGISMLDEGAKLLLLGVAGAVAAYATAWQERLLTSYHRQARDREQLEGELARAELRSLKLQLHPHFLFNALNTVTALLASDPRGAERVVTALSELLRFSLRHAGDQEIALEREVEVLHRYVDIQQLRFPDRLQVEFDIDPAVAGALVPNLLLQPLVENAIRHGIAPRATGGRVRVRASREGDRLHLSVCDNGVGATRGARAGAGVGLGNTRARLRYLYGDGHEFRAGAGDGDEGGFAVHIAIPYHEGGVALPATVLEGVS